MWKALTNFFGEIFGLVPCCDSPKVEWMQGYGFATTRCHGCGRTRVYGLPL